MGARSGLKDRDEEFQNQASLFKGGFKLPLCQSAIFKSPWWSYCGQGILCLQAHTSIQTLASSKSLFPAWILLANHIVNSLQ